MFLNDGEFMPSTGDVTSANPSQQPVSMINNQPRLVAPAQVHIEDENVSVEMFLLLYIASAFSYGELEV